MPVQVNDDRDGNRRLGSCDGDNKDNEEQAVKLAWPQIFVEGDEIQIHAVKHELQRHENSNKIPSGEEPEYPQEKQCGTEYQEVVQWYVCHLELFEGFNAMTMQPIIAASSRILTNSNGKAKPP